MAEPSSPDARSATDDGGSEAPPPAAAASVPVSDLQRRHPLWERAARASGSGAAAAAAAAAAGGAPPARRSGTQASGAAEKPRFERLSPFALELETIRGDGDGAESTIGSDASHRGGGQGHKAKRQRTNSNGTRRCAGEDDDEEEPQPDEESVLDSDLDDDAQSQAPKSKPKSKSKQPRRATSTASGDAAMLAAAAFGGDYDDDSEAESTTHSQTSSVRRAKAHASAFAVRGVDCVGCALVSRIGPVERFLKDNASKMAETALWKSAALCYKQQIMEPCEREGVAVPSWGWRDIQAHFTCHVVDDRLGRMGTVRLLAHMRMQAEQRLLRVEPDGSRELDKQSADLVLKLVAAESKERTLLQDAIAGRGSAAGGKGAKGAVAGSN